MTAPRVPGNKRRWPPPQPGMAARPVPPGAGERAGGAPSSPSLAAASGGDVAAVGERRRVLQKFCKSSPGIVLYAAWCVVFAIVCWGTHHVARTCEARGERRGISNRFNDFSDQDRMRILFVQSLAGAVFAVGTWIQVSALLFQISDKKRQLSSFVAYVNLVSMTTYIGSLCGWLQPLYGWNGEPMQMRYIEWISATPIMLMCLAALGSSMQDKLVQDWGLTARTMIWDVVMVNSGLLHSTVVNEQLGWAACGVGCFAGCMVFYGVHQLTSQSVANAATTHEVVSLRALEYFTYLLWAFFPLIHIAYKAGYIDFFQEEVAMAIMDVVAKQVYSVTLLTGNFCIMDTVATLRLDQIQAERDKSTNAVLRAEIMNQALQTQVVEAEASARLSRLFLANISHELRTPLNSVISFNSLILEDGGLSEVHEDYLNSSLTSAEALLGVINQVLEYAKLETQEDDNSMHMVDLDSKPFCLRQLCDDLCDIVTSRVNTRGADFALDNSCLWLPDVPTVLVGDSFRLRQCLINLCDNGIKFSKDEGGQVRLRIQLVETKFPPSDDANDTRVLSQAKGMQGRTENSRPVLTKCWCFDVVDNGIGIPLDKHGVLF